MGGELLKRVKIFKYLGSKLGQHLTFQNHISWVYTKSSMKLGAIRKSRKKLSLVLPHLDYCDIVYDYANKDSTDRLQILQNSAYRTILSVDSNTHTSLTCTIGKVCTLSRIDMIFICPHHVINPFISMGSLVCHTFIYVLYKSLVVIRGRWTLSMHVPHTRTKVGQQAISCRGTKHWNRLPTELRVLENFTTFKRLLSFEDQRVFC